MQVFHRGLGVPKTERPLVLRAAPRRTFRGLALFLVVVLSAAGINLLAANLTSPLRADAASLLAAAVSLALAAVLLCYLMSSRRALALTRVHAPRSGAAQVRVTNGRAAEASRDEQEGRSDLSFQRIYVDHAWVRR